MPIDMPPAPVQPAVATYHQRISFRGFLGRGGSLFFGVLLPAGVIALEAATRFCADVFFNPIPTFWHVLLATLVPLLNLVVWYRLPGEPHGRKALGILNAVAIGVSACFTLMFAPLLPLAVPAIVLFGLGLLPLSPLLSLIAAANLRWKLRAWTPDQRRSRVPGFITGLFVSLVLVAVVHGPIVAARVGIAMAQSSSESTSVKGVALLRRSGNTDELLAAANGSMEGMNDPISWIIGRDAHPTPDIARVLFYRVTGQSYQNFPMSRFGQMQARSSSEWARDWQWDGQLGSDQVGMRLKQLSLIDSRLDGTIDPDAATAYLEWTMVFRNDNPFQQREARTQIALPPGAVVSRCTLWINGEEREAAFGGRAQVREAYQKVAVAQRRDPLLVTSAGPDRVMVQCFPIQPSGGEMQIRIGITTPLRISDPAQASLALPNLVNRNFGVAPSLSHAVWLASSRSLVDSSGKLQSGTNEKGESTLRGSVAEAAYTEMPTIGIHRNPSAKLAYTDAPVAASRRRIVQEIVNEPSKWPARVVLAVDLSRSMHRHLSDVAKAIATMPAGTQVAVFGAGDSVIDMTAGFGAVSADWALELEQKLQSSRCAGGADNIPALEQAWEFAATNDATVYWIHGMQPELIRTPTAMLQRLQRNARIPVVSVQMNSGLNRVAEAIEELIASRVVSAPDIGAITAAMQGDPFQYRRRELTTEEQPPADAVPASAHLARLWAADSVKATLRGANKAQRTEAIKLASSYQLVTAATGAVVLETARQYADSGLAPIDPDTAPSVPEPSITSLLLGPAGYLLARRRRKQLTTER